MSRGRGYEDDRSARLAHDAADVAPRERREVDVPVRTSRDAVRTGTAGRIEDRHRSALRIEAAEDSLLTREPEQAVPVKGRSIEVGVGAISRQREPLHFVRHGIHADDRVQAAVGDPGRAVGPDDDAVWRRPGAELDRLEQAEPRIEPAELARELRRVPDAAVARGGDVVRTLASRDRVLLHHEVDRGTRNARSDSRDRRRAVRR